MVVTKEEEKTLTAFQHIMTLLEDLAPDDQNRIIMAVAAFYGVSVDVR